MIRTPGNRTTGQPHHRASAPSLGTRGSSRAVWLVAGSRAVWLVAGSRAVWPVAGSRAYGPSPDRVPYGPSPDRVSSRPCPCRRPVCLCGIHGLASRTPVVCHASAQHGAVADAASGDLRTFILLSCRGASSWRVRRRG